MLSCTSQHTNHLEIWPEARLGLATTPKNARNLDSHIFFKAFVAPMLTAILIHCNHDFQRELNSQIFRCDFNFSPETWRVPAALTNELKPRTEIKRPRKLHPHWKPASTKVKVGMTVKNCPQEIHFRIPVKKCMVLPNKSRTWNKQHLHGWSFADRLQSDKEKNWITNFTSNFRYSNVHLTETKSPTQETINHAFR